MNFFSIIAICYLIVSVITFVTYAMDKSAAKKGDWRTPEITLHVLALSCGWPGALLAQKFLRHKTKKQPFRMIFWITLIVNCLLLGGVIVLRAGLIEYLL